MTQNFRLGENNQRTVRQKFLFLYPWFPWGEIKCFSTYLSPLPFSLLLPTRNTHCPTTTISTPIVRGSPSSTSPWIKWANLPRNGTNVLGGPSLSYAELRPLTYLSWSVVKVIFKSLGLSFVSFLKLLRTMVEKRDVTYWGREVPQEPNPSRGG